MSKDERIKLRILLYKKYHGKCYWCNSKLRNPEKENNVSITKPFLTIDHLIPKSKNGSDRWDNLVPSCLDCNQKKGNKTVSYCARGSFKRNDKERKERTEDSGSQESTGIGEAKLD